MSTVLCEAAIAACHLSIKPAGGSNCKTRNLAGGSWIEGAASGNPRQSVSSFLSDKSNFPLETALKRLINHCSTKFLINTNISRSRQSIANRL